MYRRHFFFVYVTVEAVAVSTGPFAWYKASSAKITKSATFFMSSSKEPMPRLTVVRSFPLDNVPETAVFYFHIRTAAEKRRSFMRRNTMAINVIKFPMIVVKAGLTGNTETPCFAACTVQDQTRDQDIISNLPSPV